MSACIVLGVTGGIAAYKAADLTSRLVKKGYEVHVVMTKNATNFIAPLTLETLSKNRVIDDTFSREEPYEVSHVALAKKADLFVVAPATANILAKAAGGIADDALSTQLLACTCPVLFAPAMNSAMLHHAATQNDIRVLGERGARFIDGKTGLLACGDVGDGRMAEPAEIEEEIDKILSKDKDLLGKKLVITAGATRERIDDVRYITNRSSGKMGYALAEAAARRGADVTLISGPVALSAPLGVRLVNIESAKDMYEAVMKEYDSADAVIKAAAVADYTPETKVTGKMKKGGDLTLKLVRTRDILKELGEKKTKQILVGFAAETTNVEAYAREKLAAKNLDIIAANDVSRGDIGFGSDENEITLYFADGRCKKLEKTSKSKAAGLLLDEVLSLMK